MPFAALRDRLIEAAAAAALLGGGAQLVSNTVDIATQDTRIARVESMDAKLDDIQREISETRESVVRLETKLEKTE